ncbi:ABC transporter permease [Candidatus Bathyarchaeota archaeon]|nr:MAG: ABC transporter permease [Candidatus Bathyarchaeota archaeon]
MIWFARSWHGTEPIQWSINLLASLTAGVYFPPEILPKWLRAIGYYLPQTYALKAAILAILRGFSLNMLLPELITLLFFVIVLFPAGAIALKYSLKISKKKATLI